MLDLNKKNTDFDWGDVRILVVDGDEGVLELFKKTVWGLGAYCDTANNVEEALLLVSAMDDYHICFVDYKAPHMSGLDLDGVYKPQKNNPRVTVVMAPPTYMNGPAGDATGAGIPWDDATGAGIPWDDATGAGIPWDDVMGTGIDKIIIKPESVSDVVDLICEILAVNPPVQHAGRDMLNAKIEGKNILLVDSDTKDWEIVFTLLKPVKLHVECAGDDNGAIRMFGENPDKYDIIFINVQNPDIDGIKTVKRIRASGARNAGTIPVIAITASVFREDMVKCYAAGMNDCVGTPLSVDEVMEIMNKHLTETAPYGPATKDKRIIKFIRSY